MTGTLVTGATGFIGRQVLALLKGGAMPLFATARATPGAPDAAIWLQGDLLAPGTAERVCGEARATHLIHLAWDVNPANYWTAESNEQWVQSSIALLHAHAENGGTHVVVAGTSAELITDPPERYVRAKRELHTRASAVARDLGLGLAWARVYQPYGPGEHPDRLVPSLIRSLRDGCQFVCTSGATIRDFVHVHDVAAAFVTLSAVKATGSYDVASGVGTRVSDVVGRVARTMGAPDLVRFDDPTSQSPTPDLVGDSIPLVSQGWTPVFDLDAGLKSAIEWWTAHDC